MADNELRFSRLRATADSLAAVASRPTRFDKETVLLTGESSVLATANGKRCFLDCIRLLARMTENLTVCVAEYPEGLEEVESLVEEIAFERPPRIIEMAPSDFGSFDAILSVGCSGDATLPWTVINSNGWTARVASTGLHLPSDCSQSNPVGALAAACLGATEVFKRLLGLPGDRGPLFEKLFFSVYSYRTDCDDAGPSLPERVKLNLLLVGAGAIGNGIVHLLRSLSWRGRADIVDRQTFADENWGTCILVGRKALGRAKAEVAEELLKHEGRDVKGHRTEIDNYIRGCGSEFPWPKIVLTALDEREPRRRVQDIWPDQIIDGALGPTACEVSLHPWGLDLACLKCDFREPPVDAVQVQVEATGLAAGRVIDVDGKVEESDVQAAPEHRKDWLRSKIGKPFCSVISEGVLASLSVKDHAAGFQPSVPFVACLSACMVIAELVRYVENDTPVLETGFQFDVLVGPQNGQHKNHGRKLDCVCVERRDRINDVRQRRF